MRPGGGKPKGNQWERDVCRQLSLWISKGKRDDVFWRSAMSGGRATVGLKKGTVRSAQAGDISAIDPLGNLFLDHFMIECKSYKNLELMQGITKNKGLLYNFWAIEKVKAKHYQKMPIVIGRQNHFPTICLLHRDSEIVFGFFSEDALCILPKWSCYVLLFSTFLSKAKPPPDWSHYFLPPKIEIDKPKRIKL